VGRFGDDAARSLTQTFQVDSTFDLKTIFLEYEFDPLADQYDMRINIEIFEVADVGATSITQGKSVLTLTALNMPNLPADEEAAIVLDTPLTLAATSGTAGYALRISNGGIPGFEWLRTVGSVGSVYAHGQAYEDGNEKFDGERDFVLALSSMAFLPNADFDGNGQIDGQDFLRWQRGESPHPFSREDLALWEAQYGSVNVASASVIVPEPVSYALVLVSLFFPLSWCSANRKLCA